MTKEQYELAVKLMKQAMCTTTGNQPIEQIKPECKCVVDPLAEGCESAN